ncbi:MAG: GNAT family N-acetyltransferase [Chloroflexota bacterium]
MNTPLSEPPLARVSLRAVIESDLPIFFEHQRDPESNRMAAFPARDEAAFMAHWHKILRDESNKTRTILYGGVVVGNIASFTVEGQREVGYWIGKEYWGKGIATGALAALLDIEPIRPLYAHVVKHNIGSRRVLEKCGFILSGEDSMTHDDGTFVEEYLLKLD